MECCNVTVCCVIVCFIGSYRALCILISAGYGSYQLTICNVFCSGEINCTGYNNLLENCYCKYLCISNITIFDCCGKCCSFVCIATSNYTIFSYNGSITCCPCDCRTLCAYCGKCKATCNCSCVTECKCFLI